MFRSSLLVTSIALCASVLGFVVQLLIASNYGISVDVDAYLFAISAPTFIAGLASSILSYELVPRIVSYEFDPTYQKRYINSLIIGVFGFSLLLCLAGGILSILQILTLPIDATTRSYKSLPKLIILAWSTSVIQIIQGCLTAILNANRRYLTGSLLTLLPYLGMITLTILLESHLGIIALPLGMMAGSISACVVGFFLLRRHFFPFKIKGLLWQEMSELLFRSPYTAVAMTCFSSYAVIDAFWASLAGQGTLATLGYAQRLVIGFGNLAVAGPSAVLVPRLMQLIREKDFKGFSINLVRALLVVGGIAISVAILMAFFSDELIEFLFARGSFGSEDVRVVAKTLNYMAPGMVAMLLSVIMLRALFCFDGANKTAGILGICWTIGYFITSMFAYKFGAPGLASGYSAVWILYFCILAYVVFKLINKN